jgi:hypothetical protein
MENSEHSRRNCDSHKTNKNCGSGYSFGQIKNRHPEPRKRARVLTSARVEVRDLVFYERKAKGLSGLLAR